MTIIRSGFSVFLLGLMFAGAAQARSLKGTYEVPTDEPELQGSNIYPVELANSGDFLRDRQVRFGLPATLVGEPVIYEITNIRRGEKDVWEGQGIETMECAIERREYVCHVTFTPGSITLNEPAIEAALKLQNPAISDGELLKFMSVSRRFEPDPIGVLRYEVRGGDRQD